MCFVCNATYVSEEKRQKMSRSLGQLRGYDIFAQQAVLSIYRFWRIGLSCCKRSFTTSVLPLSTALSAWCLLRQKVMVQDIRVEVYISEELFYAGKEQP